MPLQKDRMEGLFPFGSACARHRTTVAGTRFHVGVPTVHPRAEEVLDGAFANAPSPAIIARLRPRRSRNPTTQLLSNGTYNVMVTTCGSRLFDVRPTAVTRWREDVTRDNWGASSTCAMFAAAQYGQPGISPYKRRAQSYEVAFSEDKADFWRTDGGIATHMEIVVSAEDNAEIRRVSLTNNSTRAREIELRATRR